ncbi:hypothetical protein [Streptomyces sp. NBC_00996]|uniref:hypothetical protein n=1 Tax=Streptomyces sp. NBC_00996 TaxID=2903710 RepID=UPI00386507AD|nr:hypothetical protein OG390_44855 [Streptomyces sp. NBC_00996]
MATALERSLLISNISVNAVGVGSAVLGGVADAPEWIRPAGIVVAGIGAIWALWKYVPFSQPAVARGLTLGLTAVIAAVLVVFTWPNDVSSASASSASAEASWAKTIARLKQGIKPSHHASIGCTTTVSGTGWIPDHFDIWTAVVNDTSGNPDTSRLFGLEKATSSGGNSWTTAPFSVGVSEPKNDHYWIFVYLVHDDASSILTNAVLPEGSQKVSLNRPIEHATLLDQIPVERAAQVKC